MRFIQEDDSGRDRATNIVRCRICHALTTDLFMAEHLAWHDSGKEEN